MQHFSDGASFGLPAAGWKIPGYLGVDLREVVGKVSSGYNAMESTL